MCKAEPIKTFKKSWFKLKISLGASWMQRLSAEILSSFSVYVKMVDKEKLSRTGQEHQKVISDATPSVTKAKDKEEFRIIVRLADKDIPGEVPTVHAITLVKGASFMYANAACNVLKLDKKLKIGDLPSAEFEKLEDCLRNPAKYKIPEWLFNRRKDRDTGEDKHILSSDLDLAKKFDIQFLRKIKSYRGFRHGRGDKGLKVKVRGQRTRSTGRKGKTMGVQRKKLPQKSAKKTPSAKAKGKKGGKKGGKK